MSDPSNTSVREFYAETYDESVPDWPGEIDFYQGLATEARRRDESCLEIACGTGRVAIRLAKEGTRTVGLDYSEPMLKVAREKSKDLANIRWVLADMRNFDLGESFGLALIPGHAFHNMDTAQDQADCMASIYNALKPGGRLAVHTDHMNKENIAWLGDLVGEKGGVFEPAEQFRHAKTGKLIKASHAWSYEPATQSVIEIIAWETVDEDGKVIQRLETQPTRLHVLFRFEMEHILRGAGFEVEAVYGDFFQNQLADESPSMVWMAKKPGII